MHHVTSRIVGDELLLGPREKEILQKMLWDVSDFCGVEILTYCILSNHFHVLVRVPASTASGQEISDEGLLRRFRVLYPKPTKYQVAEFARLEKALLEGNENAVDIRKRLLGRMHDLPEFIKTVMQPFTIWYNRNRGDRSGTLWMESYKTMGRIGRARLGKTTKVTEPKGIELIEQASDRHILLVDVFPVSGF